LKFVAEVFKRNFPGMEVLVLDFNDERSKAWNEEFTNK